MKITYIDEPNMIVPLAASFNQRGILGYTQAVTNQDDQIKLNSVYEPVHNFVTGKTTLYLAKRPGVTDLGNTYGTSSNVAYLHERDYESNTQVVIYTDSNVIYAASATVSTLVSTTDNKPLYVGKRRIGGNEELVLQAVDANFVQQVFHADSVNGGYTEVAVTPSQFLVGKMEFLDGYAFQQTNNDAKLINSELNSWTFTGNTNWITRDAKVDTPTGLARFGQQIISFGEASMEVFRNAGTPFGSPLETVPALAQNFGLPSQNVTGSRHYYTVLGQRLYWRGSNPFGVFAYNGQTVEKVSSLAIDKILAERQHYFVGKIGFSGQIAVVIGLNLVTDATQRALLFFPEWKDWFLWESTVIIPQTSDLVDDLCLGVGSNQNKLYRVASSTQAFQDAGTNYTWMHQVKFPKKGNGFQRLDMFGLVGDTATAALNIGTQFSTDDWQSLSASRVIDMTAHKKSIYRCGAMRSALGVRLSYTGSEPVRLEAVMARIT